MAGRSASLRRVLDLFVGRWPRSATRVGAHRSFDPRRVGGLECAAWVAYYRHEWLRLLASAVPLTRHTFALSWRATAQGAWLVLRANQLWAPVPDNDPDGARRTMQRFYELVLREHGESFDPVEAARLEVDWWRIHREQQYAEAGQDQGPLIDALVALYSHVYGVPGADVRLAAEERALAMRHSDRWFSEGRLLGSPLLAEERAALVRSYAALLAAIHRVRGRPGPGPGEP